MSQGIEIVEVDAEEAETRVDRWFRRRFPHLTQGQIEKLLRTGQVRVDGARVKANDRLQTGQKVRVPPIPVEVERVPREGLSERDEAFVKSLVIHRDADLIVLNKPSGLATQGGTKTTRHVDAFAEGLKFGYETAPKLVHRLDRDTSGVLILARTIRAAQFLTKAFKTRETRKIYWAVTNGVPKRERGEIRGWMKKAAGARDGDRELVRAAEHGEDGAQFAITDYVTISAANQQAAWVSLKPVTGRTHQLRFHMAELGCPIAGDPKYRSDRPELGGLARQLHLHARALECPHPDGSVLRVVAPLPPHMKAAFEALGFDEREAKNAFEAFEE
jgi:23S rRNA pseudouridine955/2504/2580 synthase